MSALTLGKASLAAAALTSFLMVATGAGCAQPEGAEVSSPVASSSSGDSYLYGLESMRTAREYREKGAYALGRAYAATIPLNREANLNRAEEAFVSAQEAYHEALVEAAPRYRPVIENEIATVADYLRQIQRHRLPPD